MAERSGSKTVVNGFQKLARMNRPIFLRVLVIVIVFYLFAFVRIKRLIGKLWRADEDGAFADEAVDGGADVE